MYSETTHEMLHRKLDDLLGDHETICSVIEIFNDVLHLNIEMPQVTGNLTLTCEIQVNVGNIRLPKDITMMTTMELLEYLESEIGFDLSSEVCNSGRLDDDGFWDIDFGSIEDWEHS